MVSSCIQPELSTRTFKIFFLKEAGLECRKPFSPTSSFQQESISSLDELASLSSRANTFLMTSDIGAAFRFINQILRLPLDALGVAQDNVIASRYLHRQNNVSVVITAADDGGLFRIDQFKFHHILPHIFQNIDQKTGVKAHRQLPTLIIHLNLFPHLAKIRRVLGDDEPVFNEINFDGLG